MFLRTEQAGALIQLPVFVLLFLAPVYVPITLISGWVHTVATINPATAPLEAIRGLIAGSPTKIALTFVILAAGILIMGIWLDAASCPPNARRRHEPFARTLKPSSPNRMEHRHDRGHRSNRPTRTPRHQRTARTRTRQRSRRAVRHPENATDLSALGVTLRACDYDNPETLADAFEPGDRVLLISSNDFVNSVSQHTAVIEAARASEVSLLAYTSLLNAAESPLSVAQAHRATEPVICGSGLPYTLLRNNLYSEHFAPFAQQAMQFGTFASSTRDGRVASASRRDFAAAAAGVLTEPGHEGKTYELSGDIAWSNADLVETLSAISGTEIRLRRAELATSTAKRSRKQVCPRPWPLSSSTPIRASPTENSPLPTRPSAP